MKLKHTFLAAMLLSPLTRPRPHQDRRMSADRNQHNGRTPHNKTCSSRPVSGDSVPTIISVISS